MSENAPNGSSPLKAIVLTREHKAIYPQERARIQKVRAACIHHTYISMRKYCVQDRNDLILSY